MPSLPILVYSLIINVEIIGICFLCTLTNYNKEDIKSQISLFKIFILIIFRLGMTYVMVYILIN